MYIGKSRKAKVMIPVFSLTPEKMWAVENMED